MKLFQRDFERYEGVRPIHIYLLRTLFLLMFLFVGYDSWSLLLRHDGPWDHVRAVAWCMFASYSFLAILGVFQPLKMLPLVLFVILYKSAWLFFVAYPLCAAGKLHGSPAEAMADIFMWVPAAFLIVPWGYVWRTYVVPRRVAA